MNTEKIFNIIKAIFGIVIGIVIIILILTLIFNIQIDTVTNYCLNKTNCSLDVSLVCFIL